MPPAPTSSQQTRARFVAAGDNRPRDYLRYSEVARKYLFVSVRTVRKYVSEGHLQAVDHAGCRWVPLRSVERFLDAKEQQSAARAASRRALAAAS